MTMVRNIMIIWHRSSGWQFAGYDVSTAFINMMAVDFYSELIMNIEFCRN